MGGPPSSDCQDLEKENNVDPDDGNSWSCHACTLPIFSTPFISTTTHDGHKLFWHDQCVNLPEKLFDHALHRRQPLILKEKHASTADHSYCSNCHRECGSMIYQCCNDSFCKFELDLLCALQIKIRHRSHHHRLMAIRSTSAPFTCGACGTQHQNRHELSYFCHLCDFWIHPDCASLPNAILSREMHQHSLFLTYYLPSLSDSAGSSKQAYNCAICKGNAQGIGVYFCGKCRYYVHINCVISDAPSLVRVLIRDAELAGLLHFPMPGEFTSVMRYIMGNTTSSSVHEVDTGDKQQYQIEGKLVREKLHQHPLIFHDQDGDDHPGQSPRVCNACVQLISPPFYSCCQCPDFFLHSSCASLPREIQHPIHKQHKLFLSLEAPKSSISGFFFCRGCKRLSNGFAYVCSCCNFAMDVVCALMPPSITHESHGKAHILYMSHEYESYDRYNGCNFGLGGIFYECRICHHFKLDVECVLLPNTIKHDFDEHLLQLTTKPEKSVLIDHHDDRKVSSEKVQQICEICENDIELSKWYYICSQCDHLFHRYCIHSANGLSSIKFGVTIHVDCHNCPLTLTTYGTVCGYHCGYCQESFIPDSDWLAYECSNCYFRIHGDCAEKCMLKSD